MRKIAGYFGLLVIAAVMIAGFIAYFVTSNDPRTGAIYDGFNRLLGESAALIIFGSSLSSMTVSVVENGRPWL